MEVRRMQPGDADAIVTIIVRNLREVNVKDYPEDYIEALVRAHDRDVILDKRKNTHMYVACEETRCWAAARFRAISAAKRKAYS